MMLDRWRARAAPGPAHSRSHGTVVDNSELNPRSGGSMNRSPLLFGTTPVPATPRHSRFGNVVIIACFAAQALDGVLTYLGVRYLGPSAEGNPLMAWLMSLVGEGPALAGAKLMAVTFGIGLHLTAVHRIV